MILGAEAWVIAFRWTEDNDSVFKVPLEALVTEAGSCWLDVGRLAIPNLLLWAGKTICDSGPTNCWKLTCCCERAGSLDDGVKKQFSLGSTTGGQLSGLRESALGVKSDGKYVGNWGIGWGTRNRFWEATGLFGKIEFSSTLAAEFVTVVPPVNWATVAAVAGNEA